jgi:thioredoxin 1
MVAFITELNSGNFTSFTQDGLVLVDIWATWCGPCKMIAPLVDEVSSTYQGRLSVGKLDADGSFTDEDGNVLSNKDIISELGVRNIPTLLLYKNGELVTNDEGNVEKLVGNVKREKLVDFIERYI